MATKLELERYADLEKLIADGDPEEMATQVRDMTRRATVLEVNEMLARRKAEYLEDSEALSRRQYDAIRTEQASIEAEVRALVLLYM